MRAFRCLLVWLLGWFAPGLARAEPPPQSILVLDPANVRGPFYHNIFVALRSTLNANAARPVSLYAENLDLSRFTGSEYEESLRGHFRVKYRDKPIGVIVAVGSPTLEYVLRWREELWPGAPVVFVMVDEPTFARLKPPPDVTGTVTKLRFEDIMTVARAVVPDLQRVAILGDSLEGQVVWRHFRDEIRVAAADVEIIDLTGMAMRELRKRVAALPGRTAILYTGIYSDGEGTTFPPADAVPLIAEAASQPIVVTAETFLGRGSVGGFVMIPSAIGEDAARLALRVLAGESPASIPVATGSLTPVFDWRQLQRLGISEDRLPQGSEIRFRNPAMWQQHRLPILIALAVVLVQASLITWLLYEHRRRRRSEGAAHELSGRLIHAQEEERSRLARELHDDVTQRLALLAIDVGHEERNLHGRSDGSAMRSIRERVIRLSEDVHSLSYRLHPSVLEDLGLVEALRSESERFSRTCPLKLEVNASEIPLSLPRDAALCLFRIAQEGLRNVARHAGASRVELSLRRLAGGLQLAIRDDGVGFDSSRHHNKTSLGHASMRQRAVLVGGKVDIESSPGRGTIVLAWIPLKKEHFEPSPHAAD
jgi:signal transduction histidine kinase